MSAVVCVLVWYQTWRHLCLCRETIARVTGGMKVKADRDEVSTFFCFASFFLVTRIVMLLTSLALIDTTWCLLPGVTQAFRKLQYETTVYMRAMPVCERC